MRPGNVLITGPPLVPIKEHSLSVLNTVNETLVYLACSGVLFSMKKVSKVLQREQTALKVGDGDDPLSFLDSFSTSCHFRLPNEKSTKLSTISFCCFRAMRLTNEVAQF